MTPYMDKSIMYMKKMTQLASGGQRMAWLLAHLDSAIYATI